MTTNDGGTKKGVFLLGFDDIVYGSEAARESQDASLKKIMGDEMATQFWEVYERSRNRLGGVSVPLILQEFFSDFKLDPPQKREVERVFFDFPFAEYLYHSALEILSFLMTLFQFVLTIDG